VFDLKSEVDRIDPEKETKEIREEKRRRAVMINKINRAMEEICFLFTQKVIDGDTNILVHGLDERQKR
jgi:hypothetical protein